MKPEDMRRLQEGLSILKEALEMDDATRKENFGTKSLGLIIRMMEEILEMI